MFQSLFFDIYFFYSCLLEISAGAGVPALSDADGFSAGAAGATGAADVAVAAGVAGAEGTPGVAGTKVPLAAQ